MTAQDRRTGAVSVRLCRDEELRTYLEVHASAIRGLAAGHYPTEVIEAWVVPPTSEAISDLVQNKVGETRLVAEVDGEVVGIGAVVLSRAELRACYVAPRATRMGCGTALVREIERMARESGLSRLHLVASVNAEPFYASLGYRVRERGEHVLSNGCGMAAVWMEKDW